MGEKIRPRPLPARCGDAALRTEAGMVRWSGSILYVAGIQVVRVYTAMRSWWSGLVWIYTLRDLGSPSLVWIYTPQRAARSGLGSRTQFFSRYARARGLKLS